MSSSLRSLFCFSRRSALPVQGRPREPISISSPSKGLDLHSYISPECTSTYTIKFEVPGHSFINTTGDNFSVKPLEVEIQGPRTFTGRFQWTALRDGEEIACGWNDINALTGNLERETMLATKHITPFILPEVIIVYGFYDAGRGEVGLPKRHQCYVTITPHQSNWMGSLAQNDSVLASRPFSRFVLPSAHDAGMNNTQTFDAVMQVASVNDVKQVRKSLPGFRAFNALPDRAILPMLSEIVYGLAYTQKKTIEQMLLLGVRYFEWRPARLLPAFKTLSGLPDKFYFTHGPIPGMATDDFLDDIIAFLDAQKDECVVIHFRNDGIAADCKQPNPNEIDAMVGNACVSSKGGLQWGRADLLQQSIAQLRSANTRLICLNMSTKYDSYDDKAYATLKADPIIARFEGMSTSRQEGTDLTILQCQATATRIPQVVLYSVLTTDAATSCLTATKALLDLKTLPWIRDNALGRLQADNPIVIMNDFVDGATVDTAVSMSKTRLELA